MTVPHTAAELKAALVDRSVPADDRDGVAVAQYLRMAADAWAAARTEEIADRTLGRSRFLRLLERGLAMQAGMASDLRFEPEGLRCTLRLPSTCWAATSAQ